MRLPVPRSSAAILLTCASAVASAIALYLVRSPETASSALLNVGIALAVTVLVGFLIAWSRHVATRQKRRLFADTDRAVEALARRARLEQAVIQVGASELVEARGLCSGIPVTVRIQWVNDGLSTEIFFPRKTLDGAGVRTLTALVEHVSNDAGGLSLRLDRAPRLGLLLDYDRVPETDVGRLHTALSRACELLQRLPS